MASTLRFTVLSLVFAAAAGGAELKDSAAEHAANQIREDAIRGSMKMLAHDLMEGREAGSRGYDAAAAYMASRLEELGLSPAGNGGSFFQKVPLRAARVVMAESSMHLAGRSGEVTLVQGEDFLLSPHYLDREVTVEAPLVFAAYGISAPELGRDDYAGLDVRGKIVILLRDAPASFPHNQRAYYSSSSVKAATAAANGAVGMLRLHTPEDWERTPWSRSLERAEEWGMRWFDGRISGDVVPEIRLQAALSATGAEKLFSGGPLPLARVFDGAKSGAAAGFELPGRLRARVVSEHRRVESSNVAAMLRGSDERLRSEFVVYTAHLDGLGTRKEIDGDRVFNGAFDNASGCAVLLEVARAFRSLERPPPRSILFLAVTAEEKGLQGADYFVNHPTVPLAQIVANLNMDMFLALAPVHSVVAFGSEHSSLGPVIERAAARTGFVVRPDHAPEEVIFIRSDQYPFVRKGIPAIFVTSGLESDAPHGDARQREKKWMRETYHGRNDDMRQPIDLPSLVRFGRLNFYAGLEVARKPERPEWEQDDFFGRKFSRTSD